MKVTAGRIDSVLERPGPDTLVLLIYGPDAGLVRERAERAVLALIGAPDDPFRVATLHASPGSPTSAARCSQRSSSFREGSGSCGSAIAGGWTGRAGRFAAGSCSSWRSSVRIG